ncbi:MAG TPA: hypothetical protein VK963_01300 [Candidatus Saccharimonadales bacterium]|nr:hypothetical protein [Candidatus Saccharimonadales bacterium]
MRITDQLKKQLATITVLALVIASLSPITANAGSLTETYVRLDRLQTGVATSVRVVLKPATVGTEDNITVSFPSFTVNATQTVSSASCATGAGSQAGATALPGTLTAAGSGTTVTVSGVTDLTVGTRYCFDLTSTSAVTNPAAGQYLPVVTTKAGGSTIDTVTVAVRVITNDQITVTAAVPASFNFVLDSNSTAFTADLDSAAVRSTTGRTVTVNTNAKTGWIAWAKDSDATLGLRSTAATHTIASAAPDSNGTVTAGTEGYRWGVSAIAQGTGAGSTSAATGYDATGVNHGSGLDTTLRPIASSTGTAANAVITLTARAAISASTPAASDYTDTITVVGAGNF